MAPLPEFFSNNAEESITAALEVNPKLLLLPRSQQQLNPTLDTLPTESKLSSVPKSRRTRRKADELRKSLEVRREDEVDGEVRMKEDDKDDGSIEDKVRL